MIAKFIAWIVDELYRHDKKLLIVWGCTEVYNAMYILISEMFYATADDAQNKLDTFYACNRLDDEQYAELTAYIEEVYGAEE